MRKKIMLLFLAIIPMLLGTLGYIKSGKMLTDSLYGGLSLYFMSPVSEDYNIYIEIARWTAPLVTATTILCALKTIWLSIKFRLRLFRKSVKVAVYSDEKCDILFEKEVGVIYPRDKFKTYAENHIIMFSDDRKSMNFYEQHKKELAEKEVFIGIKEMECGLLKTINNVTFYDTNTVIARLLWKKIALWEKHKREYDIVIYGDSKLVVNTICVGLQLNLFSLDQKVRYHIISDNDLVQNRYSGLRLMNEDELLFYKKSDTTVWNVISQSDIVIIADELEVELLQTIVVKAAQIPLYYYSPKAGDLGEYISFGKLIPFGRDDQVLTDDNIRRKKVIDKAIKLNASYAEKYHTEPDWKKLSGFLQSSNISTSDFGDVLLALSREKSENELARLEHIRWCRFYFLNHYTYGVPADGKNRDDEKRIHKDLVAYDNLDQDEQKKDIEAITIIRNSSK